MPTMKRIYKLLGVEKECARGGGPLRCPGVWVLDTNIINLASRNITDTLFAAASYAVARWGDKVEWGKVLDLTSKRILAKDQAAAAVYTCLEGRCIIPDAVLFELRRSPHSETHQTLAMLLGTGDYWAWYKDIEEKLARYIIDNAPSYYKMIRPDPIKIPQSVVDYLRRNFRIHVSIASTMDRDGNPYPLVKNVFIAGYNILDKVVAYAKSKGYRAKKIKPRCDWYGGGWTYTDAAIVATALKPPVEGVKRAHVATGDMDIAIVARYLGLSYMYAFAETTGYRMLAVNAPDAMAVAEELIKCRPVRMKDPCTDSEVEVSIC